MSNYFNNLNFRNKLIELKKCRFMEKNEFSNSIDYLKNKTIVIVGCGSQGLNQGLNMRDSGLNIAFALRKSSISKKNESWKNAKTNNFHVGTYESLIPTADLVINLTPDKQHQHVVKKLQLLMKKNAILGFSHGFYVVEINADIRKDITVIMVAPKCPGTEVREEYKRNFGVPTLIAVHSNNDINNNGLEIAKAWAVSLGSHKAGVLHSSFIAEVKSDLMGEQTILCGMLQAGSLSYYQKLVSLNVNEKYAGSFIQFGWEVFTESLKHGGITLMLDRLSNINKIKAYELCEKLKTLLKPLFCQHMDNIISGDFSSKMICDWNNNDFCLHQWRKESKNSSFELAPLYPQKIFEETFFEKGTFMIALLKAGIELSFEIMVETGILEESAYYESLHELPLIANTIARKRLYEMNVIISDTAEYGSYLFANAAIPILNQFMIENSISICDNNENHYLINNSYLYKVNESIKNHPIELIGKKLRSYMTNMKSINFNN
ncbi:ketol-acid reductoisomerase [Buchnera aphidicola (Nipponaphis monzeni)]|uniref:Ketol-acid reductoisomerase n=1 Tax=Buchnera aphidicola (Nipponaphis monzeni) TaxID=2495405 RepID=A0A455TAW2_9GAMM|nr:ketol-acid reductoisomerase [Buchnera aphidicola]BBI01444.1 ketol-acid reductoisomerase [Buchnera aphidicola (Nipponaphis monzeni)]